MNPIATNLALVLAVLLWVFSTSEALASDRAQPVSDEFSTLYQRVLSRPGAALHETPGGTVIRRLPPFQVFYIYEQDPEWTKVGTRIEGGFAGYIATPEVLSWSTSIVATFNNRAVNDRGRALIFESEEKFRELMAQEELVATSNAYREAAIEGRQPIESGILSIEPAEYVDIRDRLYILPILEHQRLRRLPGRNSGELLKIASMAANDEPAVGGGGSTSTAAVKDQVFQFVFVIDTTKSMRPYIDGTKEAISEFARQIAGGPVGEAAEFGLVEFRDNTALAEDLGYVTKIVLPLAEDSSVETFLDRIAGVEQAEASSSGFNEDSLAGLHTAITQLDWEDDAGKFIFLVTDAGPRTEDLDVQGLQEAQVRQLADEKGIAITTWHLTTDAGSFDHASAAEAYRALSQFGSTNAYRQIPRGDETMFRESVDTAFAELNRVLADADQGVIADDTEEEIDPVMRELGLAMQLAYLGAQGGEVRDVFEGYILSQGIPNFGSRTLDIRVMLTRNQLASLRQAMTAIAEKMNEGVLDPVTLFGQIQNALALLAQDGTRLAAGQFEVLGDGAQNFLQALPYQSELMELTQEDWIAAGSSGQIEKRLTLESKLRAYDEIYADPSLWTALADDAPEGEHVSLILLSLMP